MALRNLPDAISRAALAASQLALCPLRDLRQHGITAHLRGSRAGRGRGSWADPEIAGVALRPLPVQIFFRASAAAGSTSCGDGAGRIEIARANEYGTFYKLRFTAERLAVSYWRNPYLRKNQEFLRILVARTGIEPVVSALRGRRVKPITLPGHSGQSIVKRTFQQSESPLRVCACGGESRQK